MSLLSYNRLVRLVEEGVITADVENISGASIDITLDDEIMVELDCYDVCDPKTTYEEFLHEQEGVDLKAKESIDMYKVKIPEEGYRLYPGEFILASSREVFNLPNNVAAEYKLKSSLARSGLQHMLAGWCDPSWTNSKLTLELKNVTESHVLILKKGMKIGQMIFFECEPVPEDKSYAKKGQYNSQETVTANKGVR